MVVLCEWPAMVLHCTETRRYYFALTSMLLNLASERFGVKMFAQPCMWAHWSCACMCLCITLLFKIRTFCLQGRSWLPVAAHRASPGGVMDFMYWQEEEMWITKYEVLNHQSHNPDTANFHWYELEHFYLHKSNTRVCVYMHTHAHANTSYIQNCIILRNGYQLLLVWPVSKWDSCT